MTFTTPRRLAFASAAVCFLVLTLTAPAIPIVWDEGEGLWRAGDVRAWLRLIRDPTNPEGGFNAFSEKSIHDHFRFVTREEGHPSGSYIPVVISEAIAARFVSPLTAGRLGTIVVFSVACGAVAFRTRKAYGVVAAITAVTALITFPRLFSEAHFTTLDGQLTAWWLVLWVAETSMATSLGATLASGVLAAFASAVKFTGWLVWPPLIIARAFSRDRRRQYAVLLMVPIALLVFWALNPPLWQHPIEQFQTHVQLNTHRTLNVPIAFLGRIYDLHTSLPWYNTVVWLVFVTPVPLLILGAIGVVVSLRTRDLVSVSLLVNWATMMIIRALPGMPPHDGIRLLLPAFGFWCVLCGVGAQWLWSRSRATSGLGTFARAAIVVGLASDAVSVARYYPQTLSHYSLLVGGVRGAAAMGMEPTYWWDALDAEVLTWLNEHTEPGANVAFSSIANVSLIRSWNLLKPAQADRRAVFKWYVLQNRTGFLASSDKWLMRNEQPAFTKFAGHRAEGARAPIDLNVPLILIYSFDQYHAALAAAPP